jgi:hypothetical protein
MYEPRTAADERRMLAAHGRAAALLGVEVVGPPRWGWHGRTVGAPAAAPEGPAWLRVLCVPAAKRGGRRWSGTEAAATAFPEIPKPRLLRVADFDGGGLAYRAELTGFVADRVCSPRPALEAEIDQPAGWWRALRGHLDRVAGTPTDRVALRQDFLDGLLPAYLGAGVQTAAPAWSTAHADLHWANLTAAGPMILDWEDWGRCPAGFDAAMLHTYSLLVPRTAARVAREFADVLDGPAGRFAAGVVVALLLRTVDDGDNAHLEHALRGRRRQLAGRP